MKRNIHPKYHQTKIKCACGATYDVGSTVKDINVEICAACHPFFTGKQKTVDTAGRVDRFKKRMQKTTTIKKNVPTKKRSDVKTKKQKTAKIVSGSVRVKK